MPSITSEEINQKGSFPVVTVAMPVYNAGGFLRHAVLSIVKQTFTNWELLIIDDGSTDDALDSIADIEDSRIILIRDGHNKGLAFRLNQAIDLAKGTYFARMDQDDISYPERFERQVFALNNSLDIDLVSVRSISISNANRVVGYLPYEQAHEEICAKPWRGFLMAHPTWMGRVEWFRKYRYSHASPYFCEDQELLLRSYESSRFLGLPEILFAYRLRNKTSFKKLTKIRITLFKLYLNHFVRRKQAAYMGLSILVVLLNMIKDIHNRIMRIPYAPHRKSGVSERDIRIFNGVITKLDSISLGPKASDFRSSGSTSEENKEC